MEKKLRGNEHKILLELLRKVRKDVDLKQKELADRLGEPQSFISKYESGERRLDILELKHILDAMHIPFSKFSKLLELKLKEGKYSTKRKAKKQNPTSE